jgi:hypothetical protein
MPAAALPVPSACTAASAQIGSGFNGGPKGGGCLLARTALQWGARLKALAGILAGGKSRRCCRRAAEVQTEGRRLSCQALTGGFRALATYDSLLQGWWEQVMEDWTKRSDEEVFSKVGEQPDSQASYWRDIEIKRRVYLLQKQLLHAQIDAVETQEAATTEAVKQSTFMLYSTIGVFLTALVTLATAYFHK